MRLDETTRNVTGRYLEISFMFIQLKVTRQKKTWLCLGEGGRRGGVI